MANKQYIDFEVKGEEKIILALERQEVQQQANLRELVDDLATFSAFWLISHVPVYDSYLMRHIDRDGPQWFPGGAGGGGEWKAVVGIKDGRSRHPEYVEFGTGIYAGKGRVYPVTKSALAFRKRGEGGGKQIVRAWTRGQRPQQYFYITWRSLNAYAAAKVAAKRLI
jgi:hypothetical protein